ncbi:MAG: hypothetical protein SF182_27285 [Deltaproteobacteria bacterium]|nr:hypothetical protein [Deltaproteobacteria bacterium]
MHIEKGHLVVGSWQGVPVQLHWSLPLGMFVFSGFAFAPTAWFGIAVVVLVHEIGHAMLGRRLGIEPTAISLHGFGGECELEDEQTRHEAAVIAWGGVLAQLALCAVVVAVAVLVGVPDGPRVGEFLGALTYSNLRMAAFNLLPIPPLDGSKAWWLLAPYARRAIARLRRGRDRLGAREALRRIQDLERRAGETPLDHGVDAQLERILRDAADRREED